MLEFKQVDSYMWKATHDNLACYVDHQRNRYIVQWTPHSGRSCDIICTASFATLKDAQQNAPEVLVRYINTTFAKLKEIS